MRVEAEDGGGKDGAPQREKKKDGWGGWRQSLLATAEKNNLFKKKKKKKFSPCRWITPGPPGPSLDGCGFFLIPQCLLAASHYRMERFSLEVAQSWHFISSGFHTHTHRLTNIHIHNEEPRQQQQSSGSFLNIQAWWQSQCARSWLAAWLSTQLGCALSSPPFLFHFFLFQCGAVAGIGGWWLKEGSSILCLSAHCQLCLFIFHREQEYTLEFI